MVVLLWSTTRVNRIGASGSEMNIDRVIPGGTNNVHMCPKWDGGDAEKKNSASIASGRVLRTVHILLSRRGGGPTTDLRVVSSKVGQIMYTCARSEMVVMPREKTAQVSHRHVLRTVHILLSRGGFLPLICVYLSIICILQI
jgi:hypothetical protein